MPVTAKTVSYTYRRGESGETRALDGLDVAIEEGDFVLLAGANGSGKTTLLHCLARILRPTGGQVTIDGPAALAIQFPERALFAGTVYEDVAFGLLNQGLKKNEVRARVISAMEKVGLCLDVMGCHPMTLSHGQRRLAALAGVIAMRPRYLFLDEPTAGLDPNAKERIVDALMRLNRDGMAIVVASHDLSHFMPACKRMLVLEGGKMAFDGMPGHLLQRDDIDTSGLTLPPSFIIARRLRKMGIEAAWDISPGAAAERLRSMHADVD